MPDRAPLADRERALEDAFFRREEDRRRAAQQAEEARAERFDALSRVLGPRDPALIDPLLDLGLTGENATALVLAPLVALAWADRRLDAVERDRILRAELELGIDPDGEAGQLVLRWLERRPSDALLEAWAAYVSTLGRALERADRERLRDEILGRARGMNRALRRSLIRGAGPSRVERAVLARIQDAFAVEGEPAADGLTVEPIVGGLDDALRSMS